MAPAFVPPCRRCPSCAMRPRLCAGLQSCKARTRRWTCAEPQQQEEQRGPRAPLFMQSCAVGASPDLPPRLLHAAPAGGEPRLREVLIEHALGVVAQLGE